MQTNQPKGVKVKMTGC